MGDPGIEVLYQSDPCLVVNKPPGLSTQAPRGIDSLETRIKQFLRSRKAVPGEVYVGVPHRLDRPASGAIVFARRPQAAQRLARQFEQRRVDKVYWALVEGPVSPDCGTWEDFVRKIPGQPRAEVVDAGHPEGRLAVLHYRVRRQAAWGTWLEIDLRTGRTHQVRVQAARRGHPVLGDAQYGSQLSFGPQLDDSRQRAIALHARSLRFRHPRTQADVSVIAPVWQAWEDTVVDADTEAG